MLEEVAKYLKTDKAPPEVEKSGKEEEVDSKVKELVKENSSKEEIIAKDNLGFVGAKVEESESKAKELTLVKLSRTSSLPSKLRWRGSSPWTRWGVQRTGRR